MRSNGSGDRFDLSRPEHAYLMAFLQTDGTHSAGPGRKGTISVEISSRDAAVLAELRRITPFPSTIHTRTRSTNFAKVHESSVWRLCALEARQELLRLGLPVGRKSATVGPPEVPFSRVDYLRGLIDGDGCVGFTARGYPFVGFVTASTSLAEYFCLELRALTGAHRTARRNSRDRVFNLMVTMEPAQMLAATLYYPGCVAVPRKVLAAAEVAQWRRPATMRAAAKRRAWTAAEDREVMARSIAEAAQLLGRSAKSVGIRRWRLRNAAAGGASATPRTS